MAMLFSCWKNYTRISQTTAYNLRYCLFPREALEGSLRKEVCMVENVCYFIIPLTQANGRSELTDLFELAIPIFHAYGHKMECQVYYVL